MTYWERLLAEYVGGGDSPISPTLIAKSIITNGTFNAVDDEADGYSSVSVNVPNTSTLKGNLPLTFKTSEEQLRDWTIYGNSYEHTYSAEGTLPLSCTTHTAGNADDWSISGNDEPGENLYGVNASVSISTVSAVCSGSEIAIESDGTNTTVSATSADWKNNLSINLSAGSYGYKIERMGTTTGIVTSIYDANNTSIASSQTSGTFTLPADASVYMGFYISANTTANGTIKLIITAGSTAPDHYIPYQQGVGERTVNLFDKNDFVANAPKQRCTAQVTETGIKIIVTGNDPYIGYNIAEGQSGSSIGGMVEVEPSTTYCLYAILPKCYISFLDADKTGCSNTLTIPSSNTYTYYQFTTPSNCKYIMIRLGDGSLTGGQELEFSQIMLVEGSTAPAEYVPYGYEIPISVSGKNKMPVPVNGVYSANRTTVTVTDGVYHIVQTEGSGSSNVYISLPEFEVPDSGYINYLNSMAFASSAVALRYNGASLSGGDTLTPINRAVAIGSDYAGKKVNQIQIYTTGNAAMDFTIAPMITDSNTYATYIPYFHNDYTFYIGSTPLTSGQSISKTSTGVDISAQVGENTISTTLYNKPSMSITGLDYVGVGEPTNDGWQIPLTVSDGTSTTTVNVPIDAPLTSTDSVSNAVTIPTYVGTNTIDTTLVEPVTADIVYVGANSTLINKTINQNGTYFAYSDNANGYNSVAVAVPNTYTNEDESKVVSNGELVAQTTTSVTANGIVDTTTISSVSVDVPTAGSTTGDVRFLDYDGTVVQAYSKSEFASLTALPANPTHEGLTAQGWNWSLEDAKTYVAAYDKLDIGQMYITNDGKTRLYITLDDGRLNPTLAIAVNGSCDVDWGDGTTHDTLTGTSLSSRVAASHTYATGGDYVIALTVTGSFAFVGGTSGGLLFTYNNEANNSRSIGYRNILRAVELGEGVTSIDRYAFYNYYALSNITIPNSVTSIADRAFRGSRLYSITIPNSVTSIAEHTFSVCYALSSVAIPNSITSIGRDAFDECDSLSSVTIPSSVTGINYDAFSLCHSLSSITIPNGVTGIGSNAFYNCLALSSITISSSVTNIADYTFYGCSALSSITIPSSVTSIGNDAFRNCQSLSSITIPSDVTRIGGEAFYQCYSLGYIKFMSVTPPIVANGNAFSSVPTDCTIYVPTGSLADYTSAQYYPSSSSYTYVEY